MTAGTDIDLPKKPTEVGVIKRMFLDPTASHLIITTTFGENFYLHSQSRQPKPLSRLKSVSIECVAWNPLQPTASTREILLGTTDGNIYETFIEPSPEFYRREEKYVKHVYKGSDGPIVGLYAEAFGDRHEVRRVLLATPSRLLHFMGRVGQHGHEGSSSIYSKFFESERPTVREASSSGTGPSILAISPDAPEHEPIDTVADRTFAWLTPQGVVHGPLLTSSTSPDLVSRIFAESKTLSRSQLPPTLATNGRPKT